MTPRPIIIDTDRGQDDAVAILLALASPELVVRGITTVAGNVALELTQANGGRRRILHFGADTPRHVMDFGCRMSRILDERVADIGCGRCG